MLYDGDRNAAPYFLMPNADKIFLLNEDKMKFVGESLNYSPKTKQSPMPSRFTSVQLKSNDEIYIVGGVAQTNDPRDFLLVPNCKSIDADLQVTERAPMWEPRCSTPLALVHDKWILAIGGLVGRTQATDIVSLYDTKQDVWHKCLPLPGPQTFCSTVVQEQRHVYLMPG